MGKVTSDITMSLDGFITGPNGGDRLGDGRRLLEHIDIQQMELETNRVIESDRVTHLRFRVAK